MRAERKTERERDKEKESVYARVAVGWWWKSEGA